MPQRGTILPPAGLMLFELTLIVLLGLTNGFFAGAEIAIVGVDRVRLSQLLEAGGRRARAVHALRTNPERFFATVQIVITVVSATAGAFGGATFAFDLVPLIAPVVGERYAIEVSIAIVVAIISYLSLVLGELVPKSIALRKPEAYALVAAPLLVWMSHAVRPLVWILTTSSNAVLRLFGERTTFAESRLSRDELRHLVDEASEAGSLDPRIGELATRALDFARLTAGHVMIPRTRVVAIPRDADAAQIRRIVLEHAHSRLPVIEGELEEIVGYVLYKDLLPLAWEKRLIVLEDLIRPPYCVLETMGAPELLQEMRRRRVHLAAVIDERGSTAGIVTLDDLVEELVGEVAGELDVAEPSIIDREPDGSIIVRGDTPIRDVNRELDLELEESDAFSTVGGLCMFLAARVPPAGEVLPLEDGSEIQVLAASERAVERARIVPPKR
jgi:putative hemolysin